MAHAGEPVFIQTFIAETSVERFDIGVLVGLAGFDEKQLNTSCMRPGQHGTAAELLAIIRSDRLGETARLGQLVESAGQLQTTQRSLWNNCHRFMSRVIDHGEILDDTSFCRTIEHEIHRPDLIGSQWPLQWVPVGRRDFLSLAPSHLQPSLGIEPIHPLVINDLSGLAQFQIDHPGPVAPVALSERDDPFFQGGIAIRHRLVTENARAHANETE